MCLPSRCLAMNVYSDFTIPAFGRRVTLSFQVRRCKTNTHDKETLAKPLSDHSISQNVIPGWCSCEDLDFFGRYPVRVSARTQVMLTGFWWFCLNLLDKCRYSTSIISRCLPSRLSLIHYSSVILPFDAAIISILMASQIKRPENK
jgi:hypothetical protein